MYQTDIKYTTIFHYTVLQNLSKKEFFDGKIYLATLVSLVKILTVHCAQHLPGYFNYFRPFYINSLSTLETEDHQLVHIPSEDMNGFKGKDHNVDVRN
jgi:hypothetical protein